MRAVLTRVKHATVTVDGEVLTGQALVDQSS